MTRVSTEPVGQRPIIKFRGSTPADIINDFLDGGSPNLACAYIMRIIDSGQDPPPLSCNLVLDNLLWRPSTNNRTLLARDLILKCTKKGIQVNLHLAQNTVIQLRDIDQIQAYELLITLLDNNYKPDKRVVGVSVVKLREKHPQEAVALALKAKEKGIDLNPEMICISFEYLFPNDPKTMLDLLPKAVSMGYKPCSDLLESSIIKLDRDREKEKACRLVAMALDIEGISINLLTIENLVMEIRDENPQSAYELVSKSLDKGYLLNRPVVENTVIALRVKSPEQAALLLTKAIGIESYTFGNQTIEITAEKLIENGKSKEAADLLLCSLGNDYNLSGSTIQSSVEDLIRNNLPELACKLVSKAFERGYRLNY